MNLQQAALLRAYKRWEETRYIEILRLYEEEMGGRKKGYEWKSQHIEAELVKMGLEEPERDRDSKARKRKQVAARHQARTAPPPPLPRAAAPPPPPQYQRLPGMYEAAAAPPYGHYAPPPPHYEQHRAPSFDTAFAEQIGAQPPALTDEQNERLANEILEHNPFSEDDGDDVDIKMEMSDYGEQQQPQPQPQQRPRAASLIPGLNIGPSAPLQEEQQQQQQHEEQQQQQRHHSISASPDLNAQRSAAVARQACGEMMKQKQYNGAGVGALGS